MMLFWLDGEIVILFKIYKISFYHSVVDAKLKVLIFFLNALMDGSSFTCSGSAFQIHATVNAKLFRNIEVRNLQIKFGISKVIDFGVHLFSKHIC